MRRYQRKDSNAKPCASAIDDESWKKTLELMLKNITDDHVEAGMGLQ
jgi:hypothetical protein